MTVAVLSMIVDKPTMIGPVVDEELTLVVTLVDEVGSKTVSDIPVAEATELEAAVGDTLLVGGTAVPDCPITPDSVELKV